MSGDDHRTAPRIHHTLTQREPGKIIYSSIPFSGAKA